MPSPAYKTYAGAIEATVVTLDGAGYDSVIVSFDELSATTGTITATIKPPTMAEERTPASGHVFTVGTTTDFIRIEKADFGSLILTPATVNSAMRYRVKFYRLAAGE